MKVQNLLSELNPAAGGAGRRRVFRVAAVYAGVAFSYLTPFTS